jgi:Zn-dependent M28 family amino/carboxypeptidase
MKVKPKRSVLFLAFFGEEAGLLGSRYYGKHPLVPLAQTIANVNLEHMGRTDSSEGPKVNYGSFTGSDFSNMPSFFMAAGKLTGVEVVKDEKRSDPFFARSDNMAMARVGIPSHTICVAFEFPDYHQPGDSWEKLDYDNMVRVNRMLALGLMMMGNSPQAPVWNEANPKVKQYAEAAKKLKAPAEAGSTK